MTENFYGNAPVPDSQDAPRPIRDDIQETIKQMVEVQLANERAKHQSEMDAVRAELDRVRNSTVSSPTPLNLVPQHAGGPGTEIAPTWCQAQQEALRD